MGRRKDKWRSGRNRVAARAAAVSATRGRGAVTSDGASAQYIALSRKPRAIVDFTTLK